MSQASSNQHSPTLLPTLSPDLHDDGPRDRFTPERYLPTYSRDAEPPRLPRLEYMSGLSQLPSPHQASPPISTISIPPPDLSQQGWPTKMMTALRRFHQSLQDQMIEARVAATATLADLAVPVEHNYSRALPTDIENASAEETAQQTFSRAQVLEGSSGRDENLPDDNQEDIQNEHDKECNKENMSIEDTLHDSPSGSDPHSSNYILDRNGQNHDSSYDEMPPRHSSPGVAQALPPFAPRVLPFHHASSSTAGSSNIGVGALNPPGSSLPSFSRTTSSSDHTSRININAYGISTPTHNSIQPSHFVFPSPDPFFTHSQKRRRENDADSEKDVERLEGTSQQREGEAMDTEEGRVSKRMRLDSEQPSSHSRHDENNNPVAGGSTDGGSVVHHTNDDAATHDTVVRDTVVRDTVVRDTAPHDTAIRDAATHDSQPRPEVLSTAHSHPAGGDTEDQMMAANPTSHSHQTSSDLRLGGEGVDWRVTEFEMSFEEARRTGFRIPSPTPQVRREPPDQRARLDYLRDITLEIAAETRRARGAAPPPEQQAGPSEAGPSEPRDPRPRQRRRHQHQRDGSETTRAHHTHRPQPRYRPMPGGDISEIRTWRRLHRLPIPGTFQITLWEEEEELDETGRRIRRQIRRREAVGRSQLVYPYLLEGSELTWDQATRNHLGGSRRQAHPLPEDGIRVLPVRRMQNFYPSLHPRDEFDFIWVRREPYNRFDSRYYNGTIVMASNNNIYWSDKMGRLRLLITAAELALVERDLVNAQANRR